MKRRAAAWLLALALALGGAGPAARPLVAHVPALPFADATICIAAKAAAPASTGQSGHEAADHACCQYGCCTAFSVAPPPDLVLAQPSLGAAVSLSAAAWEDVPSRAHQIAHRPRAPPFHA